MSSIRIDAHMTHHMPYHSDQHLAICAWGVTNGCLDGPSSVPESCDSCVRGNQDLCPYGPLGVPQSVRAVSKSKPIRPTSWCKILQLMREGYQIYVHKAHNAVYHSGQHRMIYAWGMTTSMRRWSIICTKILRCMREVYQNLCPYGPPFGQNSCDICVRGIKTSAHIAHNAAHNLYPNHATHTWGVSKPMPI